MVAVDANATNPATASANTAVGDDYLQRQPGNAGPRNWGLLRHCAASPEVRYLIFCLRLFLKNKAIGALAK